MQSCVVSLTEGKRHGGYTFQVNDTMLQKNLCECMYASRQVGSYTHYAMNLVSTVRPIISQMNNMSQNTTSQRTIVT